MSASNSLIEELQVALRNESSDRRLETLRRVTSLFLGDADRYSDHQIAVFEQVFLQLVDRIESGALSEFSNQFAALDCIPVKVLKRLAHHYDVEVASPVLSRSPLLTTADLIEIACSAGQQHLLAVAGRRTLDEDVTDVLLDRGNRDVCFTVASNAGSKISPAGFGKLIASSERDALLAEKTGLRPDLPPHRLTELINKAADAVRSRLLALAPASMKDEIRRAVADAQESDKAEMEKPRNFASAVEMVWRLKKNNELTEAVLAKFATARQYEATVVTLATLASAPVDLIRPLIRSHRNDGLIVVCRAAELEWETARAVIMSRFLSTTDTDLDVARLNFRRLSISAAQHMLRSWQGKGSSRGRSIQ
ncbi:MAG: DUF2336 domain-containing protein [Xanthobacteraceae bacterium]|nr:DUF2336 domain-containing protein [Xanthobacteraceae bacterium]